MQYFDDHFPKTTFFFNLIKCLILKFLIGSTTDQKEGLVGWSTRVSFLHTFFSIFF